ncbi:MAG: TonB-dependent receptor [Deltaproteobacteria bacterium]|nr:TonB-dependent receptor [Deltaproteobacteria bacterium]
MTFRKILYLLIAVLLGNGMTVVGQEHQGRILGRVTDPSGAAIPNVTVTATNTATNITAKTVTNEQGSYEIPYLMPGVYTVETEAEGFKTFVSQSIEVRVGDRLRIDIRLELGPVTQSVTVTGETPLLDTSSATIGQVVDRRRLAELPLSGGNPYTLTRLAAGTVNFAAPNHPSLEPALGVLASFSVNGTGSKNSEFLIDGAPVMEGRNPAFIPPAEMVAEFKVQTSGYDASIGRAPGAAIQVALRSGGNKFHGTLYEFHNNNILQGIDFFQRRQLYDPKTGPVTDAKRKSVAPQHVINRFGATISGPMVLPKIYNGRNKTFWIYGFSGMTRPGTERGNYYRTVPTLAQRQGDFSKLLSLGSNYQVYDPLTIAPAAKGRFSRQPFPGNIVPASRFDEVAQNLMQYWPEPNTAGTADGRNNYFRPIRSWNEYWSHSVRVDHHLSDKHRIFGRYSQMHQVFNSGQYFPNIAIGANRDRYSKTIGFSDLYTFNPGLLMNFRYSFARYLQSFVPNGKDFDLVSAGFSPNLVTQIDPLGLTFPQITVSGLATLGNQYARSFYTNYHVFSLDITKMKGNHSLRFGGQFRLFRENNYNFSYTTPRIEFKPTWTRGPLDNSPAAPIGQGFASYLLGLPSGGRASINASYAEQSTYTAFYVQDDWRVTPKLTLNLGLRYECDSPITERYNRSLRGFDFTTPSPIEAQVQANYTTHPIDQIPADQFRVRGGVLFAGTDNQPRTLWNADRNNIGPRIGLAYSLTRSMVIRAGYGIFYVPLGVDRMTVNQTGFTQRTNLVPSFDNGQTFVATLENPFPDGFIAPPGASKGIMTDYGRGVSFFNPNPRNAYMQRWSFGIQRQLPWRVVVKTNYVGNRGTGLGVSRQLNAIPAQYLSTSPVRDQATINLLSAHVNNPFYPLLPGTSLSGKNTSRAQLLRPYPQFTGISVTDYLGYSWYHSLQVGATKRFSSGLTIQTNWTWSKYMQATSFLNPTDAMPEHVISGNDRPHRVTLSWVWELPFGRGHPLASGVTGLPSQLISGWQLQGLWEYQSGPPIGFGNVIFNGDLHDIVLPRGERTIDQWFNTNAGFDRNSKNQLAYNIRTFPSRLTGLRAFGLNMWNISALKNFRINERFKLEFRTEFLNALNHSHFRPPNTSPTSSLFGRVTSTVGWPRQVYFALKLKF